MFLLFTRSLMLRPSRFLKVTPERAALCLFIIAPLVYFYPVILNGLVLCPGDCMTQNVPYRVLAASLALEGHLPLWNPYIFGGMPLHGAMQGGVLFPPNWLFLLFSAPTAVNIVVVSTYMLAGSGAYLYARRTGCDIFGALVTGLLWQWSGFFVSHLGHTNIVQAACLLPFVLWSIDGYIISGRRVWAALVALFVALIAFAGHPQTFIFSALLTGAYILYGIWRPDDASPARDPSSSEHDEPPGRLRRLRRRYVHALAMLFAGVLLTAIQIVPTQETTSYSLRSTASYEFFTSFSTSPRMLTLYFAPYSWGGGIGTLFRASLVPLKDYSYIEYIGYVALAGLTLALLAPFIKPDRLVKFWAVVACIYLLWTLGGFLPFDLYRIVYHIPVLKLLRIPARHVMEIDFAFAVLAGRAASALARAHQSGERQKKMWVATLVAGACVAAVTLLSVTAWRPDTFRLDGRADVAVWRTPELFVPVVLAFVSAWALWGVARGWRGARAFLVILIAVDVCLWGQSVGWHNSPTTADPVWRVPSSVAFLRRQATGVEPHRVLSFDQWFTPGAAVGTPPDVAKQFVLEAHSDIYMLHRIQNASGYDGFGFARYSRLADSMNLNGDIADPPRSLYEGREFDLLNVRYLIARRPSDASALAQPPPATKQYGGYSFAEKPLDVRHIKTGARISFRVPNLTADKLALITFASSSDQLPDGDPVAHVRLRTQDGRTFESVLRAGNDTAEWAHDRPDLREGNKHRLATVAETWRVEDDHGVYDGHNYVAAFNLPARTAIVGGEIEVVSTGKAPHVGLNLNRVSLFDSQASTTAPLRREWFGQPSAVNSANAAEASGVERWRKVAETSEVNIYENQRAMPRVWLTTQALTLPDEASLKVIQTGILPNDEAWNPRRTVLLDAALPTDLTGDASAPAEAAITRYEPSRIDIKTASSVPTVLVLSENYFAGWRASVDGQRAKILRVNYNLRGISLPPGEHRISFYYRPSSAIIGFTISLLTLLALLIWLMPRRTKPPIEAHAPPTIISA